MRTHARAASQNECQSYKINSDSSLHSPIGTENKTSLDTLDCLLVYYPYASGNYFYNIKLHSPAAPVPIVSRGPGQCPTQFDVVQYKK